MNVPVCTHGTAKFLACQRLSGGRMKMRCLSSVGSVCLLQSIRITPYERIARSRKEGCWAKAAQRVAGRGVEPQ